MDRLTTNQWYILRTLSKYVRLSLALLLTSGTLQATLTCRVVYPERPKDNPKFGYIFDGKSNHQVAFSRTRFSKVIELPSDTSAIILSSSKITNIEDAPLELPSLRIPEGVNSFYILMTPNEDKGELHADIQLVDCSPKMLKTGETIWVNLTTHRLMAELGTVNMEADPNNTTITKPPSPESGHFSAKFTFQAKGIGKYAPISEQQWWHDAKSRHLGIIFDNGGKLPLIYHIRDYRLEQP